MKSLQTATRSFLVIMILGGVATLGGCSTGATREGMTTMDYTAPTKHAKTISVKVGGGQETNPVGGSLISDEEFTAALVDSINHSKVFSQVILGKSGDYELGVVMINLEKPIFGASFKVKIEAGWTLKNSATGQIVWQKVIRSEHTATMGDAVVGATRMRLANEGAARNNIKQGLMDISQLKL